MVKKMSLVEGEVTFSVRIRTFVDRNIANDEDKVKEILERLAVDQLDSADCEPDYDNQVNVLADEKTVKEYEEHIISRENWREIVTKSKELSE